jgi:hypothetical protein
MYIPVYRQNARRHFVITNCLTKTGKTLVLWNKNWNPSTVLLLNCNSDRLNSTTCTVQFTILGSRRNILCKSPKPNIKNYNLTCYFMWT